MFRDYEVNEVTALSCPLTGYIDNCIEMAGLHRVFIYSCFVPRSCNGVSILSAVRYGTVLSQPTHRLVCDKILFAELRTQLVRKLFTSPVIRVAYLITFRTTVFLLSVHILRHEVAQTTQ